MGGNTWGAHDYAQYTSRQQTYQQATSHEQVFQAKTINPYLDPSTFLIRESRNSAANPAATPVILGLDITGSMGDVAHDIAKAGFEVLIREILGRKPVSDPHIAFMGLGDALCPDQAPLQVSQFETDIKMIEQLEMLWVEGRGCGNGSESYTLAWHFANFHTSCDAFEKDARKGYIFTFGDDGPPPDLTPEALEYVYKRKEEPVATNAQLLELLATKYHVFHMFLTHGETWAGNDPLMDRWRALLGANLMIVPDHKKLAEVIISAMQITEGADAATVAKSWSGDTSVVVATATRGLKPASTAVAKRTGQGIVRF